MYYPLITINIYIQIHLYTCFAFYPAAIPELLLLICIFIANTHLLMLCQNKAADKLIVLGDGAFTSFTDFCSWKNDCLIDMHIYIYIYSINIYISNRNTKILWRFTCFFTCHYLWTLKKKKKKFRACSSCIICLACKQLSGGSRHLFHSCKHSLVFLILLLSWDKAGVQWEETDPMWKQIYKNNNNNLAVFCLWLCVFLLPSPSWCLISYPFKGYQGAEQIFWRQM